MKKVNLLLATAGVALCFTACNGQAPKGNLKTDVDSLSYSLGMANTQGLKEYLTQSLGVDTAYMSEFIKGLNEGVNSGDDKKKAAYYAGIQIGQQISQRMIKGINQQIYGNDTTKSIDVKKFMSGFIAGTTGKGGIMTMEQAAQIYQEKMASIKAKQYLPNKSAGEKFLAENKKKAGVVTLPSGLQYKVEKQGNGPIPKATDNVKVNYRGTLIDGTEFDSSYKRKEPATFRCDQVIKGWTEALTKMPVGSKWILYVPANLGYADREVSTIKPYSTLIFEIELLSIEK